MTAQTALKKAFGARLRSIRLERGLTYAAMATLIGISVPMATLIGISVPMILKYERGFSFPSVETLIDLCKELEVGADALLGLNVYEIKSRSR